jgi:hypothetical protein
LTEDDPVIGLAKASGIYYIITRYLKRFDKKVAMNSKIKYQNGRERDKFDTPNTQICESAFSWLSI